MSLQRSMNFRGLSNISVVLMSRRASAPYDDSLSEDGAELSYEGHDVRREPGVDPKTLDQPWTLPSGKATENGQFAHAASETESPLVRAYEKLRPGTWSDRGLFCLTGHEYLRVAERMVFKFRMRLSDVSDEMVPQDSPEEFKRVIPSWVKHVVYKRDKGRCVICGSSDQLHFDHELPFSRGGTGLTPENIRVLCARHNLEKGARIE